jgi:hypothetical protein
MKTMFRLPQLCSAVLLLSCTTSELPPDKVGVTPTPPVSVITQPNPDNFSSILPGLYPFADSDKQFFIKEKIAYTSAMNTNALLSAKMVTPDMGEIVKSGEKVNMVAIGGGMTAGFRNGGLYRAGQLTAYPNLVAHQMGITDFQSPLFGENEANGTGYIQLVDDGSKYPTWKEVTNNLATLKAGSPPELPRYTGGTLNNYGIPGVGFSSYFGSPIRNNGTVAYNNMTWTSSMVFASRMSPSTVDITQVSLEDQMWKQPIDFFIAENEFDMFVTLIKDNTIPSFSNYGYNLLTTDQGWSYAYSWKRRMENNKKSAKGVIFTYPTLTDLPYLNWYNSKELKDLASSISISTTRNNNTYELNSSSNFVFLPTPTVDALFKNLKKGDKISVSLGNNDILDPGELNGNVSNIKSYNQSVRDNAKKMNLAVVDLEKIYAQVQTNTYNSSDGFRLTGGGRGNFFSADGIYPSAIGQAVIANEVIKSINATYNSKIPLINLNEYSKMVGKE